ncbi:MAG TPA: MAPEG family protein [Pseudomonadales bacterium]|jgi:uncharacterized membrane protein YecN with MAPEG domain
MIPVTLLYAGVMGLMSVFLANLVLRARVRPGQPEWRGDATLRVQANFVENVPLAVVLMYLVELSGVGAVAMHAFGVSLVALRVLHVWGLDRAPGANVNYPRLIGAQGTFVLLSVLGVTAVYQFLRAT